MNKHSLIYSILVSRSRNRLAALTTARRACLLSLPAYIHVRGEIGAVHGDTLKRPPNFPMRQAMLQFFFRTNGSARASIADEVFFLSNESIMQAAVAWPNCTHA